VSACQGQRLLDRLMHVRNAARQHWCMNLADHDRRPQLVYSTRFLPEGCILNSRSSTLFMLSLEPPCTCAWHMHMQVVLRCTQAMQSHYEVTKTGMSMSLKQQHVSAGRDEECRFVHQQTSSRSLVLSCQMEVCKCSCRRATSPNHTCTGTRASGSLLICFSSAAGAAHASSCAYESY
jgi:hypothetical protein